MQTACLPLLPTDLPTQALCPSNLKVESGQARIPPSLSDSKPLRQITHQAQSSTSMACPLKTQTLDQFSTFGVSVDPKGAAAAKPAGRSSQIRT